MLECIWRPRLRAVRQGGGGRLVQFGLAAVHTDVGDSAVGAKINGRIAPLISTLRNGDEVLIVRSDSRAPPAAWESLVVTGRARAAIRRATREAAKAQYGGLGRQIVERAFSRAGRKFSEAKLKAALGRLARASIDDVFISVGRGELYSADVVRAIYPDFQEERKAGPAISPSESGWFGLAKAANLVFRVPGQPQDGAALPLRGVDWDIPVKFAPKGGAVPGERIVGIRTPGEGITIYPIHSPALVQYDDKPEFGSTCAGTSTAQRRRPIQRKSWSRRSTSLARSASSQPPSAKRAPTSTTSFSIRAAPTFTSSASTSRSPTFSTSTRSSRS